jgi:hypothetical protein
MPDRADLDAALNRFHAAGLTPVLSTNGGIPDADIEVTRGPLEQGHPRPVLAVTVTASGLARLATAETA